MPFIKILIHDVWATKDRKPLMSKSNKDALCRHVREYAKGKNIHLINVNGWLDHLHALISLSAEQNIATLKSKIRNLKSKINTPT